MRTLVTSLCAGALCALAATASAQQPDPVKVENTETVTAKVESVDLDNRLLQLSADGESTTVQVPKEVRNFDQIRVGDTVSVEYYEGIAARWKKKGESTTVGAMDVTTDVSRMPQGTRPGATAANTITTTVIIESVDQPNNSVTFTGPSGMVRTVDVKDPKAQKFIGSLKKGDEVELTYTEALAVKVQPTLVGTKP